MPTTSAKRKAEVCHQLLAYARNTGSPSLEALVLELADPATIDDVTVQMIRDGKLDFSQKEKP